MRAGLLALSALLGVAAGCTATPAWGIDHSDEQSWFLAATGLGDQLLIAGGQPGATTSQAGRGRLFLRSASADYRTLESPQPGMLWWVHAPSSLGAAWLCGEGGSVLRYEPSGGGTLTPIRTPGRATLYGIWAFSDDDVWVVGGEAGGSGVIWHGGRSGFVVDSSAPATATLYKLWATDPEHLFVVGQDGTLLRRTQTTAGLAWLRDPAPLRDRLLTAWGTAPDAVYAVGGLGNARLLHFDGQSWQSDPAVAELSGLSGVYLDDQQLLLAGQAGLVAARPATAPLGTAFTVAEPLTPLDLHAAVSALGARWAVGGNLSQYPVQPPRGVVLRQAL